MRVLFFEPYTINIPHFGTCLDQMIDHLKKGDEVWFMGCESDYKACDVNPSNNKEFCLQCRDRGYGGLERIRKYGKINVIKHSQFISKEEKARLFTEYRFNTIDELKKLAFEDYYDIGYGVASSIISMTRDPRPDTVALGELINRYLYSSKLIYKTAEKAIESIKPDRVYAYNGRYAMIRPLLRICQNKKIDIFLNEVGSDLSKYILTQNEMLHDVAYIQKEIMDFWNTANESDEEKKQKAHSFYKMTREGISKNWYSFVSDQKKELPEGWNDEHYNIVFFTTSEDEFAAIGDSFVPPIYSTQEEGIARIAESLQHIQDLRIWVRLHPNLKTAPDKLLAPYREIKNPIVKLIMPTEVISTYMVMDKADKVVTFGSTVGIEAAYWGKVSVLLGVCGYRGLGSVYEPKDHAEAVAILANRALQPLDNTAAIQFGYFFGFHGLPYKYFRKTDIYNGIIEGWDFRQSNKLKVINKLRWRGLINEWAREKIFKLLIR